MSFPIPRVVLAAGAALALVGCMDESHRAPGPELSSSGFSIVNGTKDLGRPAVGIVHAGGLGGCTGTLFASNKVLTAAHCVLTKTKPYKIIQPVYFYVGGFLGQKYKAISVVPHPNYSGGNASDLAVIKLGKNVAGVAPMPLAASAPKTGEKITIVGYGLPGDNKGQFGTKRKASAEIVQMSLSVFVFKGGTGSLGMVCNGDSGGPSLAMRSGKETIIGVHSTSAKGCASYGFDMRVDAFNSWIKTQKFIKKTYGASCITHADCIAGLCMPVSGGAVCTQGCDSAPCPGGDKCLPYSGGGGISKVCLPGSAGPPQKAFGAACSSHEECISNICVQPAAGKPKLCSRLCDVAKQNCPSKYYCIASTLGGLCVPGAKPAKSKLGEPCTVAEQCESNLCAAVNGKMICVQWCDPAKADSCPAGFTCTGVGGGKGVCTREAEPPPPQDAGSADTSPTVVDGGGGGGENADPLGRGGCATGGAAETTGGGALLLLAAVLVALARRRR